MKILFINAFYKEASTGKIVYDIMDYLKDDSKYVTYACYGRGKRQSGSHAYRICSEFYSKIGITRGLLTGRFYSGQNLATVRLIKYIESIKPDLVHIHCMNSYVMNIYKVMDYLKRNHYKIILTLHAEFMYTGSCGYAYDCEQWKYRNGCHDCERKMSLIDSTKKNWKDMEQVYVGFDNLVLTSVSPWLLDRAKQSYLLGKYENQLILNGINTKIFRLKDNPSYKIPGKKIVLHVTANFEADIKGGVYVREIAKMFLKDGDDSVQFIVIGKTNHSDIPENMVTLGLIFDQNVLVDYYSSAHVSLLTSKKETFSMICAETLCCGTPIVGFESGAPEQISLKEYSTFVPQGEVVALYNALKSFLNTDFSKKEIAEKARNVYSSQIMAEQYRLLYDKVIGCKEHE